MPVLDPKKLFDKDGNLKEYYESTITNEPL